MLQTVPPLNGQSNYDLCLQCYGSLDLFVKFCKDNSVSDFNVVSKQPYIYDTDLIVDKSITGYQYATKNINATI